ncbi:MAG: diguanylate cyclase [Candidatus Hydrogenedentota bacterium]
MQILIAEDDVTSRAMLAAMVKRNGHDVVETVDGAQAWQALQQPNAPRMAILDWMMPGMDGLEVIRRVRALKAERPPYLIMLTAKDGKADIVAGLEAGADDYLAKPFDHSELCARINVGRRLVEMQDALYDSREALAHQANHDPLTGLLNRRAILEQLDKELARAKRHGAQLAVGMCDIDHFKQINDTHGHQCGDDVLCEIARIFSENLRPYDSIGRIGGEEFLVMVPTNGDGANPHTFFERLRQLIAKRTIPLSSSALTITVSIGVACTREGTTLDGILAEADAALYQAKNEGRDRVRI